jgi:hypothetical protein
MRVDFLFWVAVLCIGCSPVGASDGREPSAQDEAVAAKEFESLTKSMEVTEGSFRSLTIGESKDQALAGLREMGVARVRPGLGEQIAVKKAEDLSKLQDAEGVIIGAGDVTIAFDGNDVQRVTVAPVYPKWNALLHGIRTRQEAFGALAQILNQSKGVEVRELAVDADHVSIQRLTPEGEALLSKYNHWSVAHDAKDGYIHMDLKFAQGVLRRVSVLEAPAAL